MGIKTLTELRTTLAHLYPNPTDIRRVVDDAGLDASRISFDGSPINLWHTVLNEAEKVDWVDVLLRVVENEYGNNREFQAACKAYRQLQGKHEDINLSSNDSTHPPNSNPQIWQQRLPAVWVGIILIGIVSYGAYWMLKEIKSSATANPPPTSSATSLGASNEKSIEETSTPAELSTSTLTATLASPTSIVIVTESSAIDSAPQTATPLPQPTPTGVESLLCSFAFLVLDDQSEEPIRRATIAVFVGVKQDTGTTDSTGYYLAKLPCSNAQDVEAQVRVSADDYTVYNRSVFLNNETTEILLERKATSTPTNTQTVALTPMPTPQLTETVTLMAQVYPCEAQIVSLNNADLIEAVRDAPSTTSSTTQKQLTRGTIVLIWRKPSTDGIWYEIWADPTTRIGWIPAEYLRLSPSCLN